MKTTKMIGSGVCGAGTAGVGNVGHGDAWVRDTWAVELGPGSRDLKRVVRASKKLCQCTDFHRNLLPRIARKHTACTIL